MSETYRISRANNTNRVTLNVRYDLYKCNWIYEILKFLRDTQIKQFFDHKINIRLIG